MIFKSALSPKLETDQLFMVIALVGTTVVLYNLFLHASLVNQKWKDKSQLIISKANLKLVQNSGL